MSQLKITSDTSQVKKSILELSSEIKKMGGSKKVSIFDAKDRNFIKSELNKELSLMKSKLIENRSAISKMVSEAAKLTKGSKEELKLRKEINAAYRTQAVLGKEINQLQSTSTGGGIGGFLKGIGKSFGIAGLATKLATGAIGAGTAQYRAGVSNRVRLQGLGISEAEMGAPSAMRLASAGLDRNTYLQRRAESVSRLGRGGASERDVIQQARFERAFGLESGALSNTANSLRGGFGGAGANEAQMKIQASVLASGMEDAIGPYLESMTSLLSDINENGLTQTDELINVMTQMSKQGVRTPEQLARAFGGINEAMRGSTGERNAFFQLAMSRAGIGGGTIGGTQLAVEGEGLFGMNRATAAQRYSPKQMKMLEAQGAFKGIGSRGSAILNLLKSRTGVQNGQNLGDVVGPQFNTLSNVANEMFGTKGRQGFEMAKILEDAQSGKISQKEAEAKFKEMRESDPNLKRLDDINKSLSGSTDKLDQINSTLKTDVGGNLVGIYNSTKAIENAVLGVGQGATSGVNNYSGTITGAGAGAIAGASIGSVIPGVGTLIGGAVGGIAGGLGGSLMNPDKSANMPSTKKALQDPNKTLEAALEKAVEKGAERGTSKALNAKQQPIRNKFNISVMSGDGSVSNNTIRKR